MPEIRAQVAYHFKLDPATMTGPVRLPEQITRTVSVGEHLHTEKVASIALPVADRVDLLAEIEKQAREATRTAKPVGEAAPAAGADPAEEEMSAF